MDVEEKVDYIDWRQQRLDTLAGGVGVWVHFYDVEGRDDEAVVVDAYTLRVVAGECFVEVGEVVGEMFAEVLDKRWGEATPATWNARITALQSFVRYCRHRQ